jgi:hypothetical protein
MAIFALTSDQNQNSIDAPTVAGTTTDSHVTIADSYDVTVVARRKSRSLSGHRPDQSPFSTRIIRAHDRVRVHDYEFLVPTDNSQPNANKFGSHIIQRGVGPQEIGHHSCYKDIRPHRQEILIAGWPGQTKHNAIRHLHGTRMLVVVQGASAISTRPALRLPALTTPALRMFFGS